MTDIPPDITEPTVPPLLLTLVHDYSQKLLTAASIWALTHGAQQFVDTASQATGKTDQDLINSLIQVGVGAAGIAASCAWTLGAAYLRKQKMEILKDSVPNNGK